MTATLAPHQAASPSPNGTRVPPPEARSGRRDRTRIALGLIVIILCVLATASLFSSTNNREQVLTVRRPVPAGHAISPNDLGVARVSVGPDVAAMPAAARERVVGRVAAVTLVAGSLLVRDDVSDAVRVPDGMAVVGASLKAGQYPVSLAPGDTVRLVETAPESAVGDSAKPIEVGGARVLDVERSQSSPDTLAVSLLVPKEAASKVAGDGAAGRLSLAVVSG
jgi:hypothetical protein